MRTTVIAAIVVLFLVPVLLCSPVQQDHQTILVLSSHQGDKAYIPCYAPNEDVAVWKINGLLYPATKLPYWIRSYSDGIIVHDAFLIDSGNYTCFGYDSRTSTLKEFTTTQFKVYPRDRSADVFPVHKPLFYEQQYDKPVLTLKATTSDDIYIPCIGPQDKTEIVMWKIDDLVYPVSYLPPANTAEYRGILVQNSSKMTGQKYECFASNDSETIQVLFTVTVCFDSTDLLQLLKPSQSNKLQPQLQQCGILDMKLISKTVFLSTDLKEFGITINPCNGDVTCLSTKVTYRYDVLNGSMSSVWNQNTSNSTGSIPSSLFREQQNTATARAANSSHVCAKWDKKIRVNESQITAQKCTQEGGYKCINVPFNLTPQLPTAMWPKYPNSVNDCYCPIFKATENTNFSQCACFHGVNKTVYDVELVSNRLCFKNLTSPASLLIVADKKDPNDRDHETVRIILSATKISVQGPDPYPPDITESAQEGVCITSESMAQNPVTGINVTMRDRVDGTLLDMPVLSNEFCISMKEYPRLCAPFMFSATAFTKCTKSPTAHFNTSGSGNNCDCIKEKVTLTLTVAETLPTSITLQLNATCVRLPAKDSVEISNLYAIAQEQDCRYCEPIETDPFSISCPEDSQEPKRVSIDGLKGNTGYDLFVAWDSPLSSHDPASCLLVDRESAKTKLLVRWIVGIAIGGVAGVSVLIGAICLIACCIWWLKRKKTYNT